MGNATGNVISAQVFVSGERRYWEGEKKKTTHVLSWPFL